MKVIREAHGDMPQLVRKMELPLSQLNASGDLKRPDSDEYYSVLESERLHELAQYGGRLIIHMNGYGSEAAHEHNTRHFRTGEGEPIVTLLALRPTPGQQYSWLIQDALSKK